MKILGFILSALVGIILLSWGNLTLADETDMDFMNVNHAKLVRKWLVQHKQYRMADINDCECIDFVLTLQKGDGEAWKPQPNYQPYYAVGDFKNDGHTDFAVVVRRIEGEEKPIVLIYLGSVSDRYSDPISYYPHEKTVAGVGLFLSRSKPTRLLIGAFASEGEIVPISKAGK